MQNKSSWYEKSECLALSFIIHVILLLLASLHQEKLSRDISPDYNPIEIITTQQSTKPSDRDQSDQSCIDPLSAPLINAPCILYKGGGGRKTADTSSSSGEILKKVKVSLEGEIEGDTLKNTQTSTYVNKEEQAPSEIPKTTEPSPQHSSISSEVSSTPSIATISSPSFLHSNEPIASKKEIVPELFSDTLQQKEQKTGLRVETVFETSGPKTEEAGDGTRKRKLTLSDLFKNLSSSSFLPSSENIEESGDGSGAPAVIVQGDIRYHSFMSSIVDHINSTSKHRHGNAIIGKLIQSGTIKQNLKLSITLAKNGSVLDARTLISSGCPELDTFWITTAREASPFAPLPDHFKRNMVRVELTTQL